MQKWLKKLAQAAQPQGDAQQAQSNSKPNDDVVDAEFEEVKDNKIISLKPKLKGVAIRPFGIFIKRNFS